MMTNLMEIQMKSPFAIRAEDALSWHRTTQQVAGIAQRAGWRIRSIARQWEVWATDADFAALVEQSKA